ncbi:uncharacterized protein LOC124922900 [Impatiens glandulifera]|uniref:uncharacterized protein LOC124922900 n=1 Tax=Impatiens glandulifera TaxID=253017 RepID=UPI001FB17F67|nr:uncharacterized protein LOC124922900 [Impatiens glandulifera]
MEHEMKNSSPEIFSVTPENNILEFKSLPENNNNQKIHDCAVAGNLKTVVTPDRLKVPKPLKYPERYKSPTDQMMSPISKGILARTRKGGGGRLLPPSLIQPKDLTLQEFSLPK